MNKKVLFSVMVVCLLVFSMAIISCGDESSKLVGTWEGPTGTMVLSKDGTANLDGLGGTWKAEKNQILFSSFGITMPMDYKLSGKNLTLTYGGDTETFTKK